MAGADRMNVMAQIAVKDLLAGAEFALNSDDDLALACFLRSPLGGVGEDDLFALAHGRQGSLWRALVDASDAENAAPVLCARAGGSIGCAARRIICRLMIILRGF